MAFRTTAAFFKFSRWWDLFRIVIPQACDQFALFQLSYFVVNSGIANENLFTGVPFQKQSQIGTRMIVDNNRAVLDRANYSNIGTPTVVQCGR